MSSATTEGSPARDAPPAPVVLVTGIGGFTGAVMRTELTNAGYRVVGTALGEAGPDDLLLDVESAARCRDVVAEVRPDYVIHLAGISFVPQSDPARLYAANAVGTVNLLDALVSTGVVPRKVLLASSATVYGNVEGAAISESFPFAPANHYAASKVAMECLAATFFDRFPIVITRPFNYTGVGQDHSFLVPKIVSHFARGDRIIELGNIDVERDFSDVRIVANVYRRLLESATRSRSLNICSGRPASLRSVIDAMQDIAGYEIEVRVNPAFVRSNEVRRLVGDPAALAEAVGGLDTVPLRSILGHMFEAMRRH